MEPQKKDVEGGGSFRGEGGSRSHANGRGEGLRYDSFLKAVVKWMRGSKEAIERSVMWLNSVDATQK